MNPATLLRAVRKARRLSQRELASLAGVRPSTVDRIESGQSTAPSLAVIEKILHACGYRLAITGHEGRPFELDEPHGRLLDRGGRNYPAHLDLIRMDGMRTPWWGWLRIAFYERDPHVPEWIYHLRSGVSWLDPPGKYWPFCPHDDIT